jgi:hypothetical protein
MDWIRVNRELPTHWKSLDLAEALNEPLAWAYVVRLWAWCIDNAPAGEIPGRNPARTLEQGAGWTGAPGELANALVACGFVDRDGDAFHVHDWENHNGKALKHAKDEAKRLADYREKKTAGRSGSPSVPYTYGTGTVPVQNAVTRRDVTRRDGGGGGAASPATPTTPPSSVRPSPSCPPGWEPLVHPVSVSQPPELPDPLHGFEIPWSGGVASYDAAGAREMAPAQPPEGVFWAWCAYRQELAGHGSDAVPSRKQLRTLRAALETYGPERLRKAWLCWLADPWAEQRDPPFALGAFLSADQLAQQLGRAQRAQWGPDLSSPEDFELLDLGPPTQAA